VFNGESTGSPILAIFSGPNIPPSVISGGNIVLVWFVTDAKNNFAGWKAHYRTVE
jgi:serine protease